MGRQLSGVLAIILLILSGSSLSIGQAVEGPEKRESILDRTVHLEERFLTEMPPVARLCDELRVEKHRIDIGGCELYVEEEGQGTPLLLINGGPGGTHHCFHPWFSRAKDFAKVIYYDQRGCGLSDYEPGKDGYSVDQAIEDLEALRKALGLERWAVLGYSYGGFLAQYYVTKYPESVAGLILLGASPGMWIQMKPTRQYDFLTKEERTRIGEVPAQAEELARERKWEPTRTLALKVYNAHLNGDWKRQHFYRPSSEDLARTALYEWNHDLVNNFRRGISRSMDKINLTGAFEKCLIPTLILEGRWDLTWNTDKPGIIAGNHPGAKLVLFENAGHGIYGEEPDRFFTVLRDFMAQLQKAQAFDVTAYKSYLKDWHRKQQASPLYVVRTSSYSSASLAKIARAYSRSWCDELQDWPMWLLKVGTAHYEVRNYTEAFYVFGRLAEAAQKQNNVEHQALGVLWQGQMLDLLGRREEAVKLYQRVADLNINETWQHDNYGLKYELSPYARERMKKPFVRIENSLKD